MLIYKNYSCFKAWPLVALLRLLYSLSCLCLKIINGPRRLFLMEEREENKLCHLFMGDLGDERKKAREPFTRQNGKYNFLISAIQKHKFFSVLTKH